MNLIPVLNTVLPVFLIVALGFLYGRRFPTDIDTANRLNMEIFTPALIFSALSAQGFQIADYSQLALAATLVVLGSGLVVLPFVRLLRVDWKTFVPPMMFTNSGNMGIPILLLAFGEAALPAAIVLFLVENTLHFTAGMYMVNHRANLWNVLRTPMILASIAGIAVSLSGFVVPSVAAVPIEMMGQIAIPLMLFTLGVRMVDADFSDWRLGLWGAVLAPVSGLVIAGLLYPWLTLSPEQMAYLFIFAALPPAVLNYMVAEKFQQEPKRVASIVFIANLLSIFSLSAVLAWVL
ncbi:AEC family transporter [Thioalkalivibrio sulfidiphilus]|uniref:Auxin Efflux Carrier n=1 Tax=Thioalkalivibrio sulfidiphilus (strain HL-EbGR7) TaxID=396588 RepID=B8GTM6_THISH|nr:AEC family transporter [Thioalkalivibrio sulfidiphilus]ACL73120.1 Auxin Efflux Carrier [Thioalkalivibrio sulfidiphilus HL-EbGr7]